MFLAFVLITLIRLYVRLLFCVFICLTCCRPFHTLYTHRCDRSSCLINNSIFFFLCNRYFCPSYSFSIRLFSNSLFRLLCNVLAVVCTIVSLAADTSGASVSCTALLFVPWALLPPVSFVASSSIGRSKINTFERSRCTLNRHNVSWSTVGTSAVLTIFDTFSQSTALASWTHPITFALLAIKRLITTEFTKGCAWL